MAERYLGDLPEGERLALGNAVRALRKNYETIHEILIGNSESGVIVGTEDIYTILETYVRNGNLESTMDSLQHDSPDMILKMFEVIGMTKNELKESGYIQKE